MDAYRLMEIAMFKTLIVATWLAGGAGVVAFAGPVSGEAPNQDTAVQTSVTLNRLASNRLASNRLASNRLASNRLASNRLASNRLASNRLAANGLSLDAMAFASTSPGDVTPLVTIVAVTLSDGTRMELSAPR
jgi:hypothetical protein